MSWSVSAQGKPKAVLANLEEQFARIHLSEPEKTVAASLRTAIEASLNAFPPGLPVKIAASGSQYQPDHKKPDEKINTANLEISPIYGFLE